MKEKILIANRGEIACRVIRSARALGFATVAVHSDADANALHVRLADERVSIGPARAAESYLKAERILAAARDTGAVAIHPGYGFLAENAVFAEHCAGAALRFIGPDPASIRDMGDKQRARAIAAAAGVPVLPGSGKLDGGEAAVAAETVGFPLLVKAAAGGGGIGLRPVDQPGDLAAAIESTARLAERAFGDGSVYLERLVRRARHVEVQLFGFGDGEAVHLFDRECSLQRRYQKILEEARAPNIGDDARAGMAAAAVALARACRYRGAGTVEFLYDDDSGDFFFMEMNTRLQVEHPVTEMTTGLDLVALQIRQAFGDHIAAELAPARLASRGHAIELRICAEDARRNFLPSPGRITALRLPSGDGIRVDSGYESGDQVTPYYDSLVMKLIAHGDDRAAALAKLEAALAETLIDGVATNIPFLRNLLAHQDVVAGRVHTRFVEQHLPLLSAA